MNDTEIENLNRRFARNGATVVAGEGGLPKVVVSTPHATGEMYLHGAQITSWRPAGKYEVFYLSPNSSFQTGRAIRGGIPVCFPWFGDKADDPAAPAHGFVRTKEWQLRTIESSGNDVVVSISTQSDESTRNHWPYDFGLVCRASFGDQLRVELVVTNTGSLPFSFEEALHAYFAVEDAANAAVRGLDSTRYLDKTVNRMEKLQSGDIHFSAETDRIYLDTTRELELFDPTGKSRVRVEKQNSDTTVIWNPWSSKSIALKDLGPGEWKKFVCIETTNVMPSAVKLLPGESHEMAMVVQASR